MLFTRNTVCKALIYFLCLSLLLMLSRSPIRVADANERIFPIGEMVSKGEVRFEARGNTWRSVEPFHFPVFRGVKIKTEKGISMIALANLSQIEMGRDSMISFNQDDQLSLFQGGIDFRIPSSAQMSFKIGSLSMIRTRPLQAAKNTNVISPKSEETIGSILIHSNGSLTVKSIQGELSILDQDYVVLASLSQRQTLTIPSPVVSGKQRVMVAQAGDPEEEDRKSEDKTSEEGSLSSGSAVGWAAALLLNAAFIGSIIGASLDDEDQRPICK